MTVGELLATYRATTGYITNSLIIKSYDAVGATYKYLLEYSPGKAYRKEVFIATEAGDDLEARTVITSIEISPAE